MLLSPPLLLAVEEVRRNLAAKLPEAMPLFHEFLRATAIRMYLPAPHDHERAVGHVHPEDVPILAAAGVRVLATHNVRHERQDAGVRMVRPRTSIEEARARFPGTTSPGRRMTQR